MKHITWIAAFATLFLTTTAFALEQVETVGWDVDLFNQQVVTVPAAEVPDGYALDAVDIDFSATEAGFTAYWEGDPPAIDVTWTFTWFYEWFDSGDGSSYENTELVDDAGTEFFCTTPTVYTDTNPPARYLSDWTIAAYSSSSVSPGGGIGALSFRKHFWHGEIVVTYTFSKAKGINP